MNVINVDALIPVTFKFKNRLLNKGGFSSLIPYFVDENELNKKSNIGGIITIYSRYPLWEWRVAGKINLSEVAYIKYLDLKEWD